MEVILVHGLWYGPWAMTFLARRLRHAGFAVRLFSYRATAAPVAVHAQQLSRFVRHSTAASVHVAGHSLGGLVITHMLATTRELPPGRIVLLGTPLQGSKVARKAAQLPCSSVLFGQVSADLCHGRPLIESDREIGMIAGCRAIGLGRLLGSPGATGDGTVELREADAPGLTGRLVLPVSHTGMLYSRRVAQEVGGFLQHGRFSASVASRDDPHSW